MYVYPQDERTKDHDPLYLCPIKEKPISIPSIHPSLHCSLCLQNVQNCQTVGFLWFCYNCEKEQLKLKTLNY